MSPETDTGAATAIAPELVLDPLIAQKIWDRGAGIYPEEAAGLYEIAMEAGAKKMMEVGARHGSSSMTLALVAKETGGHLWSLDPVHRGSWHNNMKEMELTEYVTPLTGVSPFFNLPAEAEPLDLVFIDGAHGAHDVITDSFTWVRKLRQPGGIIAWHDHQKPSVMFGIQTFLSCYIRSFSRMRQIDCKHQRFCGIFAAWMGP